MRRALGATPANIVVQIMVETLTLTVLAGLVGGILGVATLEALDAFLTASEDNGIFQAPPRDVGRAVDRPGHDDGVGRVRRGAPRPACVACGTGGSVANLTCQFLNMKNGKPLALLVGVLVILAGTFYTVKHLRDQESQAVASYNTEAPRVTDIVLKTLASGSVQPRQEILIKPQVSGIVRRVLVEAGDKVEAGDVLAEVMIVPDVAALSNAESRFARAQLSLDDAQTNHDAMQGCSNAVPWRLQKPSARSWP